MSEIIFLEIEDVITINKRNINYFSGSFGIRDKGLLESALNNPKNLYFYKNADLYAIATSYVFSIIQNHAFMDGNKRTGFSCMVIFLLQNNIKLDFGIDQSVEIMIKIATKEISFEEVAEWLKLLPKFR